VPVVPTVAGHFPPGQTLKNLKPAIFPPTFFKAQFGGHLAAEIAIIF
jgi:hypothetical protein